MYNIQTHRNATNGNNQFLKSFPEWNTIEINTKTIYKILQKWKIAERKIQKEASNIFSFEEFKVFKEINLRKASNKNTFDNTILVLSNIVGNKRMNTKKIRIA